MDMRFISEYSNVEFTNLLTKAAILFMARGDREDAAEYFEDYLNFDIPQEEKESVNKLLEKLKVKNEK